MTGPLRRTHVTPGPHRHRRTRPRWSSPRPTRKTPRPRSRCPRRVEQLLQAGPQHLPVVVVLLCTVYAVDHDPTHPTGSEQGLEDGEISEVSEDLGPLVVVEWFFGSVVEVIERFERAARVVRVTGERVGRKRVMRHDRHGTRPPR